jgi:O-antigen/teichoic acid export membrane protein
MEKNILLKILRRPDSIRALQAYQLFRFAAVLATGIILAQKGFSTSAIGFYETFLFISYAASFFWLSAITNSFLAYYPKTSESRALIFNSALLLLLLSGAAAFIIISLYQTTTNHTPAGILIAIYLLLAIPSYFNEYIMLVYEKNILLIAYGFTSFIVHIALIWIAAGLSDDIELICWILILISMLKFILLIGLLIKYADFKIKKDQLKILTANSWPLAVSYLLSGSSELIDGFLVKKLFSESDFAIFRYGARELPVVLLVANAFSSAAIPKIASNLDEGLELIKKNSNQLFHLFFPLTAFLMIFSKKLFIYVFSPAFAQSALIFNIYLLLIISRLLFPQTILNGLGRNRFLMISAFLETSVNITLSLMLIRPFGLSGIAIGTLIASIFDKLLLVAYCKYRFKIEPGRYINLYQHTFYSLLLLTIAYLLSL